jgi:hypothetical protein
MTRVTTLFALAALVPAACNAAPAIAASLLVPLCSGDGQVRMVEVPAGNGAPGSDQAPCCVKGCHAGSSRKRLMRSAEPEE